MTKFITVANQKGGCAKTTTVVNLAASLAEQGYRTLVLDLDPQANASQWFLESDSINGAFKLLTGSDPLQSLVNSTLNKRIDLISASQELTKIEKILANELAVEFTLKRRLTQDLVKKWDFILIDTPPTLGLITVNALACATELLIPVTTHAMTLAGVAQLLNKINAIKELINPNLSILGYLPSRVDKRTKHSLEVLEALRSQFGDKVFKSSIRENIRLAEAPSFKESILEYDSNSGASEDFRALAKEILGNYKNAKNKEDNP
jgi:chromosome partitioning protein